MTNKTIAERDLNVLWHPCTQMKDHEFLPMIPIKSAKGVWLEDFDGTKYIDAISSWWVNIFGHVNPYISEYALTKGVLLRTLGHIVYFMPPYVINEEEMDIMFDTACAGIKGLLDGSL